MAKKNAAEKEVSTAGFDPVQFLQGTREELSKIVWPSRQQLLGESAAVLLMVVLSAALIYLVDELLDWAAMLVFK